MLKVLLVDDEPFILQGLQILIDWAAEGYEIAAALSNGKEALDFLRENTVDLILTDIQMPVMTGLELIDAIRKEKLSDARIAILTGYDDFSFAQKAIRYNILEYLLKPVQTDDMLALLRKVTRLEHDKVQDSEQQKKMEDAYLAQNVIALIKGKYDADNIEYVKRHMQLGGDIRYIDIETIEEHVEDEEDDNDLRGVQHQLYQACKDVLKEYQNHFVFDVSYDENSYDIGFVYRLNMAARLDMEEKEFLDAVIRKIRAIMLRPVRMIVGKSVPDISQIAKSYSSCCMLNSIKGFHNEKSIYIYEEEMQGGQNTSYLCKNSIDQLIISIQNNETDQIDENTEILYREMFSSGENVVNLNINYLLFQLIHIATKQDDNVNQEEILHYISEHSFDGNIARGDISHMKRFAKEYAEYLASLRRNVSRGLICNIEQDIEEHYRENITLKSLGDKYFINSSYLGQIFRKAHNMSFKDYLTKVRVERAAEMLLHTDEKISKIAEDVGYNDCDYFIRKFIEIKGCTPSKYRRNNNAK